MLDMNICKYFLYSKLFFTIYYFKNTIYYKIFNSKHFSILQKTNTYPFTSLLFYSKLSAITMTSSTNGSFDHINCETAVSSCTTSSQSITFSNSSFSIPKGYMKLNLLAVNTFFDKPNLLTTANLTCASPRNTCFKNDLAYTCINTNFLKADFSCSTTCDANTNPTYISNISASENSGFCSSPCGTTNTCLNDFTNYNTNFSCQANFTKLYLFCYADADQLKGAIHFSQYFNSPNFSYSVSPTLTDYHFEIWFYPDRRFIPNSTDTNLLVLLTSGLTIRKSALTTDNDYQLYDSAGNTLGSTFTLKFLNWYRLAFSVKQNGSNFDWSFYYNKYTASYLSQSTTSSLGLSSITFCTSCTPNTNKWFSGFYKWMRIWKGDFITPATFKEMDKM